MGSVGLVTDNPVIVTIHPPTTFSDLIVIAKDAQGNLVAGATVNGFKEGQTGFATLDTLTTDANGRAIYPHLPEEGMIDVTVTKDALRGNGVWNQQSESRTLNITLK